MDQISIHPHFSDIESVLTRYISEAEREILIAVAWFTNQNLFNHLLKAARRGVMVKLLTLYDRINVSGGLDFQMFLDAGGELYLSSSSNPVLHNKYCIIDGKYIITGSYNFTYYAENVNSENVVVITSQDIASLYTDNFDNLLKANDEVSDYLKYKNDHDYLRDIFSAHTFFELEDEYKCDGNKSKVVNIYYPKSDKIQQITYRESELVISFQVKVITPFSHCWIYSQNTHGVWRLEDTSTNKEYEAFKITNIKINDIVVIDVTEPNTCYHLKHSEPDYTQEARAGLTQKWIESPPIFLFSCDIHFYIPELNHCMYNLHEGDLQMRGSQYRWNIMSIDLSRNDD